MKTSLVAIATIFALLFTACNNAEKLPTYGPRTANGTTDSADYILPAFAFINQDSALVNTTTLKDKIFIAEFFFTSCPSICPKMQAQMLRVYEKYKGNKEIVILAFTIDPDRDSVARLQAYANKLGVQSPQWHFLTGVKDSLYATAANFLISAEEDPDAPGGHIHSGNFVLVDKQRKLRGYYDGVDEKSVDKLLTEMDVLLKEE